MSALPPKADILCAEADVRFVPIADIALFGRRLHCRSSVNVEQLSH
jgi:hypothetical protein